jgi:cell division protease FtsH
VQGIDHVKGDIKEILTMLLGSEQYSSMGAKVPRGVLLEGPPGTGKTFLARAMATEAGIPFFSANGAEFVQVRRPRCVRVLCVCCGRRGCLTFAGAVQMFQGIAAARVKALFKDARDNAPSIIFIDEVDAIGMARNPEGFRDAGSAEREQGLMQMLVEMDGFKPAERVLVVAATNRRDVLDAALLRPGRFDRTIHMGTPTPANRYRILAVHARGKQIPRDNDDALLREAAKKAVGYSGAELANMLNEAAILQVPPMFPPQHSTRPPSCRLRQRGALLRAARVLLRCVCGSLTCPA